MIAFDLQCEDGHTFEGWFEDSKAYNEQKKKNLIACPICNSTNVSKILSPVAIKRGVTSNAGTLPLPMEEAQMAEMGRKIVDYVHKNFDDVGCDFTKEALKIHYGVNEPRNIRSNKKELNISNCRCHPRPIQSLDFRKQSVLIHTCKKLS